MYVILLEDAKVRWKSNLRLVRCDFSMSVTNMEPAEDDALHNALTSAEKLLSAASTAAAQL